MPQDVQKVNSLSISNLPSKEENPDYFVPAPKSGNPDYFVPSESPKKTESSGGNLIDSVSKHIFEAPEFIKKGAKSISDYISEPSISDETHPLRPYIKGMLGGMTEGAASLLSPANIASVAMPEVGMVNKGLGALQGVSGINKIGHGDFSGLADIGFGILGMKGKSKTPELPKISKEIPKSNPEYFVPHESSMGSLDDVTNEFRSNRLEQEMLDRDKLRGTPADVAHSPIAQETERRRTGINESGFNRRDSDNQFGGMRDNSNFEEGSGGLTDIAAGRFTRHAMPSEAKAVFKAWQEDGNGGHIALYDIIGGPLECG